MKPSVDDIQHALNKAVQIMLKTTQVGALHSRDCFTIPWCTIPHHKPHHTNHTLQKIPHYTNPECYFVLTACVSMGETRRYSSATSSCRGGRQTHTSCCHQNFIQTCLRTQRCRESCDRSELHHQFI